MQTDRAASDTTIPILFYDIQLKLRHISSRSELVCLSGSLTDVSLCLQVKQMPINTFVKTFNIYFCLIGDIS